MEYKLGPEAVIKCPTPVAPGCVTQSAASFVNYVYTITTQQRGPLRMALNVTFCKYGRRTSPQQRLWPFAKKGWSHFP